MNLDEFIQAYTESSTYSDFIMHAQSTGIMDEYGELIGADAHIEQIEDWEYYMDGCGIDPALEKELEDLKKWWDVQGRRMLKGEHYVSEV